MDHGEFDNSLLLLQSQLPHSCSSCRPTDNPSSLDPAIKQSSQALWDQNSSFKIQPNHQRPEPVTYNGQKLSEDSLYNEASELYHPCLDFRVEDMQNTSVAVITSDTTDSFITNEKSDLLSKENGDVRTVKKRLQNRIAQKSFRKRKQQYTESLERHIQDLEQQLKEIRNENAQLKDISASYCAGQMPAPIASQSCTECVICLHLKRNMGGRIVCPESRPISRCPGS